jgi:hypothetical protein
MMFKEIENVPQYLGLQNEDITFQRIGTTLEDHSIDCPEDTTYSSGSIVAQPIDSVIEDDTPLRIVVGNLIAVKRPILIKPVTYRPGTDQIVATTPQKETWVITDGLAVRSPETQSIRRQAMLATQSYR